MMNVQIRAGDVPDLIRKTAEEFAGEFYDGERTPQFRLAGAKYGLTEKAYIRRYWTNFVEIAVQVLSALLAQPGTPDEQKEQIYDAIIAYHMLATPTRPKRLSMRSLQ